MLEKGRLYSLRKDSTKDSVYLNIKHKRFLFGSSQCCTIRIYIDGIFPKHCVLTIGDQGKAYLEPLHPSGLTLVNGIKIKRKICLEDNDVITIFVKEFQFAYPPNSLSSNVSIERLLATPFSKQVKPAQKFETFTFQKNLKTSHPFRECKVPKINYIPKKLICMIDSDIFRKIPQYLLKSAHHQHVNISCENINAQEDNFSCPLMKYMNRCVEESFESRKNLALKLYEFFSFIRGLLNRNEEYIFDLLRVLESVWKYCIARASEDILFLPLKSFYLNMGEITVQKKSQQSRILSGPSKNLSPNYETMSKKENHCIEQKQNQHSSRKISIAYKKRVSLAVKRYHLRKRKSIMMTKSVEIGNDENLELTDETQQTKEKCMDNDSDDRDIVTNLVEQKATRTKRKRGYNKKEKEELQDKKELKIKPEISMEAIQDTFGKENITSKPTKEKRRNKKTAAKKIDLNLGKENIAELMDNSSGNQTAILKSRGRKQTKEKEISESRGLKKESIDYSDGQQSYSMETKRSYKKKKKEASTIETALKDGMETKFNDVTYSKKNISEYSEPKSKKGNYKKKKEVSLEKFNPSLKDGMEIKFTDDTSSKKNFSEYSEPKSKKRKL